MYLNNMSKYLISFMFIALLSGCAISQNSLNNGEKKKNEIVYEREEISQELLNRVSLIVKEMAKNNMLEINKSFIHPTFGFYNIAKIDGIKVVTHQKTINKVLRDEDQEVSDMISRISKKDTLLKVISKDVKFDCSPNNDEFYGWSNEGLYINDKTETFLSEFMMKLNKLKKDTYKKDDFLKAKLIEKTSYKVILTPEIVFYLTKIDKQWYITLIDRASTDCYEKKNEIKKGDK